MKKLIIVRHGAYNPADGHLIDEGREQIKRSAIEIKKNIDDGNFLLFTSPILRAKESAEIIAKALGVNYKEYAALAYDTPTDFTDALDLIRSHKKQADIIILVAHVCHTNGFASYFAERELKKEINYEEIRAGQARVIDIDCV